jgi:hypothetical protein
MNRKILATFISLMSFFWTSYGQSCIGGKIVDEENEAVSFATIAIDTKYTLS